MNAMGWMLLGLFLALVVVGAVGAVTWALARPKEGRTRRTGVAVLLTLMAAGGLVVAAVVAASGLGSSHDGMMRGGMEGMMGLSSSGECPAAPTDPTRPTITGFRFCPGTIRVAVGTSVRWTNDDIVPHTVTSRSGGKFDSGTMAQGRSWSYRFDRAGTFTYYCSLHPSMAGTVEVSGGGRA